MNTPGPAMQLHQLQETDNAIVQARQTISQLKQQIADDTVLARARAAQQQAERRATELQQRQRQLEMDDADMSTKLKAANDQLYSGKVGNPKELSNLQHEAEILKSKLDAIEDETLGVMDNLEKADAALVQANRNLEMVTGTEAQRKEGLGAELKAQQAALAALKESRQTLAVEIEPALLSRYDRLSQAKGQAVAVVKSGICQGCRIALSGGQMRQVRAGDLIPCDNCGRFLYLA